MLSENSLYSKHNFIRHDPGALKKRRSLKIKSNECTMIAWLGIWEVIGPPINLLSILK